MIPSKTANSFRKIVGPLVALLLKLRVSPDALTLFGFLLTLVSSYFIAVGNFLAGGLMLLFSGLFDTLDGELARAASRVSMRGAFLDSSIDRLSEFATLGAFAYWALYKEPGYFTALWTDKNSFILMLFIVLFGSLLTSYLRARAEGLGNGTREGFFARPERVISTAIIAILGKNFVFWGMAVLMLLVSFTCIQRFFIIWKNFSGGKDGG
ncbi:CDP-alcohol phosphatidyltransferase family protein [candidate division WOR-3 bacterium]|nr:CDP-alcohol phosphatidyltransferase family protein [candidate division WOR-3 bacterium]